MPVALISASTFGSIRPGSGGAATARSWQTLALRQVEDREALEEWDRLGILAGLATTKGSVRGDAMLAFAYIAAEAESLAKRQPTLDRETVLDHGTP
jgi:hypothetical protein